ncbi:glutathione S-transferase family protein [Ancylobacter oerskovii]|uniref:Glutathione S-transferase family protein n=1 Tax=Ancylobacter oerskovii TaxID=459519 RepID=A0ABW4Z3P1_9HYPH|nr:glutathione S-transferase family protein [Ancylobacter oerskovii]MBS7545979.1 glutathione S-transferase family protein [Ancylobacter oerskovii]
MRLIGMLDSPYVRRVAISLKFLRLPFRHEPVSVFRHFDAFAAINPVVKAPTLVTDEGVVLMDSTLILAHAERLADPALTLEPDGLADHARAQRLAGLALAACEKAVQIVYEHELRPAEKRHEPWLARVRGQLRAAYALLEAEIDPGRDWLIGERPMQADITAAVALGFTRHLVPDAIDDADIPALAALAARAERLPEFTGTPIE